MKIKIILLLLAAIILSGGSVYYFFTTSTQEHPIGYAYSQDKVHVHSDFIVSLDGTTYDFTDDQYQSKPNRTLHAHIHLHDNNDKVIHRHDHDITIADFFNSLGFTLTDECVITDTGLEYCSNGEKKLQLYVNNQQISPFTSYVNQEEDRILLFYGKPGEPLLTDLLNNITDTACIFSGTCPERGIAPPESCGLTCEM